MPSCATACHCLWQRTWHAGIARPAAKRRSAPELSRRESAEIGAAAQPAAGRACKRALVSRSLCLLHAGCEQRLGIWQGRLPGRAADGSDKGAGLARHKRARQPKAGKPRLGMGDACFAKDGLLRSSCRGLKQARAGTQAAALRQPGLGSRTRDACSREVVGCNLDDLLPDCR